ncbi:hypothetical protein BJY00DRAFT_312760 [Aspergillus carlsbadensis]|nr:hypothetical protein BJY00DRAFT_312760 [Aspergillus carlsbadensis]
MVLINGTKKATPSEPIAIVSVACRLPGHATTPHKLWELLQSGKVANGTAVPPNRYSTSGHFDGSGRPGTMKALSGMYIEDLDPAVFDAPFFNITTADAIAMDPQQRLLLEVVYECFENGGITLERISGQEVGCFVGSYMVDYHDMQNRAPEERPAGMTVGIGRAILSNRISHFFNLKGASWTIDTACSGGLVGVDVACQYLRSGRLNGAVIAASNLWLSPEHLQELGTMRAAYSPTGRCHTFDKKADGYCRAEAVNAVYLKRLSDAIADGDPVRAIIRGTATNSDGWTPGINSPSSAAQAAVIRAAYADAGLSKEQYAETGFLECHGTGTPAGDPLEVKGAASVLASMRNPSEPLIIGSIKSNIGHSEPGAGISGLIKAMLAVEQGIIPGNPTFVDPNPNIDFAGLRVQPSRSNLPWPKASSHYRRASVNSFGYGGSNAHAVVENAEHFFNHHGSMLKINRPYISSYVKPGNLLSLLAGNPGKGRVAGSPERRPQVLVFSANDGNALKSQVKSLSAHLLDPRVKIKLSDLSYTLSERRSRHFFRAFVLSNPAQNGNAGKVSTELIQYGKRPETPARIGFVFTGQGAQWSQMGASLVRLFPLTVEPFLRSLDNVLQELPDGIKPKWSILKELTEVRSQEHLRQPEFSQPLVTALQLAQLSVLETWNVQPRVVGGHSSGEIAAAASAGLITPSQAILVAYFRGLAAKLATPPQAVGMLAVGLGADGVQPYIQAKPYSGQVVVACFNSPSIVTLSGPTALLLELCEIIKSDGHFARMLQVELAYHSHHMKDISDMYEHLLLAYGRWNSKANGNREATPSMVSSVTGETLLCADAAYWKANMASPVRFEEACSRMLMHETFRTDFLIEIGPSNALSGPIAQIAKAAGADRLTYTSAAKRGDESINALLDIAGQLFLKDAPVNLSKVNADETKPTITAPAVIIDLPNYKWNHTTKYWAESPASRDWRFRQFPEHDLLGSKVLGTLWQSPTWRKTLRLADVPWLRDHKIGSEVLFPAAGYCAMAIEAVRQAVLATAAEADRDALEQDSHYCLQNVRFTRGLVLEEGVDVSIVVTLTPSTSMGNKWWEWRILSSTASPDESPSSISNSWVENSAGFIRAVMNKDEGVSLPTSGTTTPLVDPSPASLWYKTMRDAGYLYGPHFQKQLAVETTQGHPRSRAMVSLAPPPSQWTPQSGYLIHPAPMDACFQSVFPSVYNGDRSSLETVLLPAQIDSLIVSGQSRRANEAISIAVAQGNPESKELLASASVYDHASGSFIMELKGLSFSTMDVGPSVYLSHPYTRLAWAPDFAHLDTSAKLQRALAGTENSVQKLLDLAAHKSPNMRVLELNLVPGSTSSLWLNQVEKPPVERAAVENFYFASNRADVLLAAEDELSTLPAGSNTKFTLLDPFSKSFSRPTDLPKFDVVLARIPIASDTPALEGLMSNIHRLLAEEGSLILHNEDNKLSPDDMKLITETLGKCRFTKIRHTADRNIVAEVGADIAVEAGEAHQMNIILVNLSPNPSPIASDIVAQLEDQGWNITNINLETDPDLELLPPKATILVLEELTESILATATHRQWDAIQTFIRKESNLLWVTQGSQIGASDPHKAVCHGVFRTVRAEEPLLRLVTLDVESAEVDALGAVVNAIHVTLRQIILRPGRPADMEFAERGGIIHISRVWSDDGVNKFKMQERAGAPISTDAVSHIGDVEDNKTIRGTPPRVSAYLNRNHAYFIVGGLKGICGSLAIHLARQGVKHLSIMARSGYDDSASRAAARNIQALGCSLDLLQGDVTSLEDVRRCFNSTSVPIGGIIQGAVVLRDRTFESMSHKDYHAALACKVQGTWNLHNVSLETRQPITSFTMLSSTSGLVGQPGQANYAAGNVFQDAAASHRWAQGLPAISLNLGAIEDVGLIQRNEGILSRFDKDTWFGINESLLRRIFDYAILQQSPHSWRVLNPLSRERMITGIAVPQPGDSKLLLDVRFAGLRAVEDQNNGSGSAKGGSGGDREIQAFFLLARSNDPDRTALRSAAVAVVSKQFATQLRLSETMDPARPLNAYGMDSLAAVDFRNWARTTLGVELTTLDVVNASSLAALCDKIIGKVSG